MMDDVEDENFENEENVPPQDLEMASPTFVTPSAMGQSPWPASPTPGTSSTISDPIEFERRCQTSLFPLPDDSPTGLPVRVPLLLPGLRLLDQAHHTNIDGEGGAGPPPMVLPPAESPRGRARRIEALRGLEEHMKQRGPYVSLASSRLQAAMRMRNAVPFTLRHVPSSDPAASPDAMEVDDLAAEDPRPIAMSQIDPRTGKGLYEFLLEHGYQRGHAKRECRSITFHDFTPDMKTAAHRNVLLRHYEADRMSEIHSYEVELPTVTPNPQTGEPVHGTETWLWILIRRRLVTIDMDSARTMPPSPSDSPEPFAPRRPSPPPAQAAQAQRLPPVLFPPNFPHEPMVSHVVFAVPAAHVTAHPPSVERLPSRAAARKWRSDDLVHRRADYDFSHDGVPIFEFSAAHAFSGVRTDFLSVEGMGPFYPADGHEAWRDEEYQAIYDAWVAGGGDEGEGARGLGERPCPNRGTWWREFYAMVGEDCRAWRDIRAAMERGKCRIVLRWDELKGEDDDGEEEGDGEGEGAAGPAGDDWDMLGGPRPWDMDILDEVQDEEQVEFTPASEIIERFVKRELGTIRKGKGKKIMRH